MMGLIALFAGLFCGPALADSYTMASLDWTVFSSQAVFQGRVTQSGQVLTTLEVQELLAGEAGPVVEVFTGSWHLAPGDAGIFALMGEASQDHPHLVWVGHTQGGPIVLDKHQRVLREEDIPAYVRKRAAWDLAHPTMSPAPRPISLPFNVLVDGAPVLSFDTPNGVWVPPDPEFLPLVEGWAISEKAYERAQAATALVNYPGGNTARLLSTLLADEQADEAVNAAGVVESRRWRTRELAWISMVMLGLDAEAPVIAEQRVPWKGEW